MPGGNVQRVRGRAHRSDVQAPQAPYSDAIAASNRSTCLPCPPGSYNEAVGGTSEGACLLCPTGTVLLASGAANRSHCPAGKAAVAAGLPCEACAPGKFRPAAVRFASQCSSCEAGSFANTTGLSACLQCPVGKCGKTRGADNEAAACDPSSKGMYGVVAGAATEAAACVSCPPGKYQPAAGATSAALRLLCPRGSGLTAPELCVVPGRDIQPARGPHQRLRGPLLRGRTHARPRSRTVCPARRARFPPHAGPVPLPTLP